MVSKVSVTRRAGRVRRKIKSVAGDRPRLSVYRSSKHIYVQIIDDAKGHTLAAASTPEREPEGKLKTGADVAAGSGAGRLTAERATTAGAARAGLERGAYR